MRYLKIVLSIITVLFSITNLFGLYSDGFIIGCYSYLNDNSVTNSDSVYFRFISEAHFNCHLCNSDNNSPDITNLITESDSRGLDMILTDRVWQPENDIIGVYNLLRANYWKYEAEYSGIGEEIEPEPCHSEFYYRIIRNVGERTTLPDEHASHLYAWVCAENTHSGGFAADTLYWKWQYNNKDELLENQIILPIQDTLFFDFAMRLDPLGHSNSTPICDVNVFVVNDDGEKVYLPIHTNVRLPYNNELSVGEFVGMGANGDVYVDFSFYTIVDSILEELINAYGGFEPQLKNFNFEVYWHGNGNLYIDYFKIYDDIYRKLKNGEYNDMLANRLTQIGLTPSSNSSLKYLYAKDEPRPPQFDAHRIVEDSLLWQYSNLLLPALDKYHGCYPDYHHHEFFNDYAEPEQVMLDSYPIKSGLKWNVPTGDKNIQGHINWMLNIYENAIEEFSEKPLIAIPQTYGRWNYANTDSARWGWVMRAPKEMQKCLQYLPLCYDMDGVVDFKLISAYNYSSRYGDYSEPVNGSMDSFLEDPIRDGSFHRLGLIDKDDTTNTGNPVLTPQYYAVQEANARIAVYGPIIETLRWLGANHDNEVVNEGTVYETGLTSVEVHEDSTSGNYEGYVEIGAYKDDDTGNSYFMLSNRRTNFSKQAYTNPDYTIHDVPMNVDTAFVVANSQTVTFTYDLLDSNYVLVDLYSEDYFLMDGNKQIDVGIGPGDGMMLRLAQVPPQVITGSYMAYNTYIPYSITIESGASLIIFGNVRFGSYSNITVEDEASLCIMGSTILGENSEIIVYGDLYIHAEVSAYAHSWNGIECYENGTVNLSNGMIKNARIAIYNVSGDIVIENSEIQNCNLGIKFLGGSLDFISSTITNAQNGIEILPVSGDTISISISGDEDNPSLIHCNPSYGSADESVGIKFVDICQSRTDYTFSCNYTNFINLGTGIESNNVWYLSANNEISNGTFEECDYGIYLFAVEGSSLNIHDCTFDNNITSGIFSNTANIKIDNCIFKNHSFGAIEISGIAQCKEVDALPPHAYFYTIRNCDFYDNSFCIRSRESSPRIENNIFTESNPNGLLISNNSFPNCGQNANNVFQSSTAHITFWDDMPFSSSIYLKDGHNDFYWNAIFQGDFVFYEDYSINWFCIDANGNYWDPYPRDPTIMDYSGNAPEIIADVKDSIPNVTIISNYTTRFERATYDEYNEEFQTALDTFRTILVEQKPEEYHLLGMCADKIFNLSTLLNNDMNELRDFYESQYYSVPEDSIYLRHILKEYIKRCNIALKEYQAAADIVVERIDNPFSPLDSIYAIMDLETIYMLSSGGHKGATVFTKYENLNPRTFKVYNNKYNEHWNEIAQLIGVDEDNLNQDIIPNKLLINYPNPFRTSTTICFSIPRGTKKAKIRIYNIKGQLVKQLSIFNSQLNWEQSSIEWDGKDENGRKLSSGIYFYKLSASGGNADNQTEVVKKMILLK